MSVFEGKSSSRKKVYQICNVFSQKKFNIFNFEPISSALPTFLTGGSGGYTVLTTLDGKLMNKKVVNLMTVKVFGGSRS